MLIEIFTASKCICGVVQCSSDFLLFWKKVTGIFFFFPFPLCGAVEMGDGTGWDPLCSPLPSPWLLPALLSQWYPTHPDSQLCPARSLHPSFYYQNCLDLTQLASERWSGLLLRITLLGRVGQTRERGRLCAGNALIALLIVLTR